MRTLGRNALLIVALLAAALVRVPVSADPPPPAVAPTPGGDGWDGELVDLSTGLFVHRTTDLFLLDAMPLALTRTYRSGDAAPRPFGIGSSHPYQAFLSAAPPYQTADLALADGSVIRFVRTNAGTDAATGVFEHRSTPGAYYAATLTASAGLWRLDTADGLVSSFGANAPLQRSVDAFGRLVEVLRTGLEFPRIGLITRVTSPNGRFIILGYDAAGRIVQARDNLGRIMGYAYDASGRLSAVTDAEGGVTRYTYDAHHRMLTIRDPAGATALANEYDANGRVVRQVLADGSEYRFAYTLGPGGAVTRTDVTDPRGIVRRVAFDARGYRVSDTRALGTALERTTLLDREPSGLIRSITDPLGRTTAFGRDGTGRVTSVTRLAGSAQAATTTLAHAATGGLGIHRLAALVDPLGHATSVSYDALGYPVALTDPTAARWLLGHREGSLWQFADPLGNASEFQRDTGDDVEKVVDPLGRVTVRGHDAGGRLTSETGPGGKTVGYAYDRLDRLVQITGAAGSATRFRYDAGGNLVSLTDARGKVIAFAHDARNRVVSRVDPLGRAEHYAYDANGNLVALTDRKGQVTSIGYDALDRPASVTYPDGSTVGFTWDAADRLILAADSAAGTLTRAWDASDRLLSEATPLGSIAYAYDAAGRRTTLAVAGQPPVAYAHDRAGRLTGLTRAELAFAWTHDAAGRRTAIALPNGITAERTYDAASQLTGLAYRDGAGVLGSLGYGYDPSGRRVRASGTWARVVLPPAMASAAYDDANRALAFGGSALTHDDSGNLTDDGVTGYAWDARDRLIAVDGPAVTAQFAYDPLGRRRRVEVDGIQVDVIHDGVEPAQESGPSGAQALLSAPGLDEHLARETEDGWLFPLVDGTGSVLAVTDAAGAIVAEHTYEPFGVQAATAAGDASRVRFAGSEDDGTGLYFHRARYYHPTLQRFIAENPIGFPDGAVHAYTYGRNDPVGATDPLGLDVDPGRARSLVRTGALGWDPIAGRPSPDTGLRIAGVTAADMAFIESLMRRWLSPEAEAALRALADAGPPASADEDLPRPPSLATGRRGCVPAATTLSRPPDLAALVAGRLAWRPGAAPGCAGLR